MALRLINTKYLLWLMALMLLGMLATVVVQTVTTNPPTMVDPLGRISQGCQVAVVMSDFTFTPSRNAAGELVSVMVTKNGLDPNKTWLLLSYEPSYSEFGTTMAWKSVIENGAEGGAGIATKMLRAGDLYLMEVLGTRPARQIWDTGNKGFSRYLACAEIIAKATAAQDGMPMWSIVPIP